MRTPWTVRLFDVVPVAPAWVGLGIAMAWLAFLVSFSFASGWQDDEHFWGDSDFEIVWALLIGYLPTATAYALRGATRDLRDLEAELSCSSADFQDRLRNVSRFPNLELTIVGLFAVAVGLALPFAPGFWAEGLPGITAPPMIWAWLRGGIFLWLIFSALYIEVVTALRFSRIASRFARIDLLDLRPLAPFSRRGLRSVLLLMGTSALFSLLLLGPWDTDYLSIPSLISFGVVALVALLLPILGLHNRIRDEKEEVMERVLAGIRSQGDPTGEAGAGARLSELIVYRGLIESVQTWPFDVSTLLRFGLYLLLGLGSWFGAALAERLLDSALG